MTDPVAALAERLVKKNGQIRGDHPAPWEVLAREALAFAREQLPREQIARWLYGEFARSKVCSWGPLSHEERQGWLAKADALLRDLRARLGGT